MSLCKITNEQLIAEVVAGKTWAVISKECDISIRQLQRRAASLGITYTNYRERAKQPPEVVAVLPKILFFDIETAPLQAWVWQCGKQYVGHKQLVKNHNSWGIICITYCWDDGEPAKHISWGYEAQDTRHVIEEFDHIASGADVVIGKNSDHFDIPMINAQRMLQGLSGNPTWALATDDLQKQMKKYFRMPSQSLDYYSEQLGLGGKIKMEMQDWIDIVEKNDPAKLAKMLHYGEKDVEDTRTLWHYLSEHFDSKFNTARWAGKHICKHADCGSEDIQFKYQKYVGLSEYNIYMCATCGRYAGKSTVSPTGKESGLR